MTIGNNTYIGISETRPIIPVTAAIIKNILSSRNEFVIAVSTRPVSEGFKISTITSLHQ